MALPSEYQEVEWIQSSGTQYIDTGQVPTINTGVRLEASVTSTNTVIIGYAQGDTVQRYQIGVRATGTALFVVPGGVTQYNTSTFDPTTKFTFDMNLYNDGKTWLNGVQDVAIVRGAISNARSMYLFCRNLVGTATSFSTMKLYGCKITEGSSLVRDFVPCYRKSDNKPGLYDLENSGKNLLDLSRTSGAGWLNSSGVLQSDSDYYCSDYIEVEPSTNYTYKEVLNRSLVGGGVRVCFYDANKNMVGQRQGGEAQTAGTYEFQLESPANTKYVRVSTVTNFSQAQLEKGSTATTYEPYPFYVNSGTGEFTVGPDVTHGLDFSRITAIQIPKEAPRLPVEYQEVEYIRSAGTAYINTRLTCTDTQKWYLKFLYDANPLNNIMGAYTQIRRRSVVSSSATSTIGTRIDGIVNINQFSSDRQAHELTIDFKNKTTFGDGTEFPMSGTYQSVPTSNIMIFSDRAGANIMTGNVYSCKIWENDSIVRDFVPCYRKSDDVIGMYDLVNDVFYTNAGTRTFTKGPEVPAELINVTKIEDEEGRQLWPHVEPVTGYLCIENTSSNADARVLVANKSSQEGYNSYQISSDEVTWEDIPYNTGNEYTEYTVASGGKLYFKGTITRRDAYDYVFRITPTDGDFKITGNILSLAYGDDFESQTEFPCDYVFSSLFSPIITTATGTIDASELELPNFIKDGCYQGLFSECKSLVSAPVLPSTTLAVDCYSGMFSMCTNLTEAPELPATRTAYGCYNFMFYGCTSLTEAPELPATNSNMYCYYGMFKNCTSLIKAPEIKLSTDRTWITATCTDMFSGCESLQVQEGGGAAEKKIFECTSNTPSHAVSNMFADTGGSFTGTPTAGHTYYWHEPFSGLKFTAERNSSFQYRVIGSVPNVDMKYSLDDGDTWVDWAPSTYISLSAGDEICVKGNNPNGLATSDSDYTTFGCMQGRLAASGNINSLIDDGNGSTVTTLPNYAFCRLFENSETWLTSAPELPATTLGDYCYSKMFWGCDLLTDAPELPATTIGRYCYADMFLGCDGLVNAPSELPAPTLSLNCYESMFRGCTSLATVPEIKATTLANYCCYEMFYNCTSLNAVPELPVTTMAQYCYAYMFKNCTSLTVAPELPATTTVLGCYTEMFRDCTALRVKENDAAGATKIFTCPSATNCSNMFTNTGGRFTTGTPVEGNDYYWYEPTDTDYLCIENVGGTAGARILVYNDTYKSSFNSYEISTDKETWTAIPYTTQSGSTYNTTEYAVTDKVYLRGTSGPNGTGALRINFDGGNFKLSGNALSLVLKDDFDGVTEIPHGSAFTSVFSPTQTGLTGTVDASELKLVATTLTENCYRLMFQSCEQLTAAPVLPATVMQRACYDSMFQHCTGLTSTPTLPATTLANACYAYMFSKTGVTSAPELPSTGLKNSCYSGMFWQATSLKVKENDSSGATKIFTCPSYTVEENPVDFMFNQTGGSFTGIVRSGNSYYWYT